MGGLVRTTGAGMGCPDWPKCFEQWAPPLNDKSLPEGYEDIYIEKRKTKLERLTGYLSKLGMHKQAIAIQNDPYVLQPHSYNFARAWTEYANRLVGVLTGIFALLAMVSSFQFIRSHVSRSILTIGSVLWIIINGWLGSVVVDTNLLEGMVTIHFMAAFIALALMIIAYKMPLTKIDTGIYRLKSLKIWSITVFVLLFIQIITGTQVREISDAVIRSQGISIDWLSNESGLWNPKFIIHRYLPIVTGVLLFLIYRILKDQTLTNKHRLHFRYLVAVFLLQALAGAFIIWAGNHPFMQLIHVTLGGLIFALGLNWVLEVKRLKAA